MNRTYATKSELKASVDDLFGMKGRYIKDTFGEDLVYFSPTGIPILKLSVWEQNIKDETGWAVNDSTTGYGIPELKGVN